MRALLDVNVLIALHDQDHVHHTLAAQWLSSHIRQGWASCPLTQNGCLRIMAQPAYPNAQPMSVLLQMLQRSVHSKAHQLWSDDISLLDAARFEHTHLHGHRQLTDAYLLGLAVKNDGCLVTFDTTIALSIVRGAKPEHLVTL